MGLQELITAEDDTLVNGILRVVAIAKGQRTLGRIAAHFTEDERIALLAGM
ncbi:hypothetical protein LQG66_36350 [Bradyrhizobium ontarionense]|uniref:Transposase n=1 Tax=Bradyrhizobium ontarionense TaxID=2898149 RepID=A0ABY3RBL9_9BRAD|nr:hypothetical protein [Bradyrhizobium sp. A19]UFZ04594.1 hypothetical protein LQG66_36350 [Bradyrhizobium sp. A19]